MESIEKNQLSPSNCILSKQTDENRLIIAAAAKFEAEETISRLERLDIPFTFLELGVGSLISTASAAVFKKIVKGRKIIFLGSCGSCHKSDIGKLILANSVRFEPLDVVAGKSYLIKNTCPILDISVSTKISSCNLPHATISCSPSISFAPISEEFPLHHNRLESIELYGVFELWRHIVDDFVAIFGITNQLGPNSHKEWRSNFRMISEKSADLIVQKIIPVF